MPLKRERPLIPPKSRAKRLNLKIGMTEAAKDSKPTLLEKELARIVVQWGIIAKSAQSAREK